MIVLFVILRSKLPNNLVTTYGLTLSIVGMCVFNIGLTYGLGAIGGQAGTNLPAAFMEVPISDVSPIYSEFLGLSIVILFAWILGFANPWEFKTKNKIIISILIIYKNI